VTVEPSADPAIEAWKQSTIDLLLTDMLIRDAENKVVPKDGISLMGYVLLHVKYAKPKVISITGCSYSLSLDSHARALKADFCLRKPIDVLNLVTAVTTLLNDEC